jgi:hypothetical protein
VISERAEICGDFGGWQLCHTARQLIDCSICTRAAPA